MSKEATHDLNVAEIASRGGAAIAGAASTDALTQVETEILGKRSVLSEAHRALGRLDEGARKDAGRQLHELRASLESQFSARRVELEAQERTAYLIADRLDLTEVIPAHVRSPLARGHLHLVSQARDELEDVFVGMGFIVAEGPEAESDWYNFEALNFPPGHPARAMHDTMYLDIGEPETVVLRTHTSPVQIHLMEEAVKNDSLPIHAVMPGKCFRLDTPDASHLPVFNQIEGLVVDRGITFGDLAGTIQLFTEAYFGEDMQSRLRPGYFPFTEPSAEFEITCTICRGKGCRSCGYTGWLELGGCGMVDPAVFAAVGIDPEVWSGFAFGFGIDRLAIQRHGVPDIRSLMENDIRFLSQF
jgi:phenylalanyl-tRNA synthetase alpha chain